MIQRQDMVTGIAGAGIGVVVNLLGGFDILLQALIVAVCIDVATGLGKAISAKDLNSNSAYWGGVKKVSVFFVVALAVVLDRVVATYAGENAPQALRTLTVGFYLGVEGISILENVSAMGVPIPTPVLKALTFLRDRSAGTPEGRQP